MVQGTIVVGAGVAGLQCARELRRAGREVLVLERSRGVGGRCATRRFDGQPVDFGPMFLHGHHPGFVRALAEVPGPVPGWPRRVQGAGRPCQPGALDSLSDRLAFRDGVKAFPKHLAEGLPVRLETNVTSIRLMDGGFKVVTADGEMPCRDLVLALALEQGRRLLETLPSGPEVDGILALLGLFGSVPCLTVIAGYPLDAPADWDVLLPEDSDLQLIAHDAAKREAPRCRTFVIQARPGWSRANLGREPEAWSADLLKAAAEHLGPGALTPLWVHPHRWRYARVDTSSELARPVQIAFRGGQRLGLAGDVFSPGGGVQAAWLSGTALSERMIKEQE